jgi:hypothetical protein
MLDKPNHIVSPGILKPMWIDINKWEMPNTIQAVVTSIAAARSSIHFSKVLKRRGKLTNRRGITTWDFEFLGFCPT